MMSAATSFSESPRRVAAIPLACPHHWRTPAFSYLREFRRGFDASQGLDHARAIKQRSELLHQPFIEIDCQKPAVAIDGDTFSAPSARFQRSGDSRGGVGVIGIAFDVGEHAFQPGIHRFEAAQDKKRLALRRNSQALKRVIAGCLLAGQIKDIFRTAGEKQVKVLARHDWPAAWSPAGRIPLFQTPLPRLRGRVSMSLRSHLQHRHFLCFTSRQRTLERSGLIRPA